MSTIERAKATQLANIQQKTGKTLAELVEIVQSSGLKKHAEIRSMLMEKLNLGYGDAHNLALYALKADVQLAAKEQGLTAAQVLDGLYAGPKAALRPIHERLVDVIRQFGEYEVAPKKGYLSLRRKRQFAMLGPATNTQVELGLNIKHLAEDSRLVPQPAGSMCNYKVRFSAIDQIDATVIGWVKQAYEAAGPNQ